MVDFDQSKRSDKTAIKSVLVCLPSIQIIFMMRHSALEICMAPPFTIYIRKPYDVILHLRFTFVNQKDKKISSWK